MAHGGAVDLTVVDILLRVFSARGRRLLHRRDRDVGPRSTGQSGHWLRFAQAVSRRDKYSVDQDIKIFFAVGVVAFDAFIAAWESKRYYDSSRPWTLIRYYYKDKMVRGWGGSGKGVVELRFSALAAASEARRPLG